MDIVVGIGDLAISNNESDTIKTYALASCVAVTAYCPKKKVAGMIHVALPSPPEKGYGIEKPGYYATTGIPLLINKLCSEFGCSREDLNINLFGGAESINKNDVFNIGIRNIEAATMVLSKMKVRVRKAEVGGVQSRTLEIDVAEGNIKVSCQPIIYGHEY
ncbi:MAG: chemotaxis protein CheD [Clostridia bacterium]|nr:chemotaxis protein CheD [Clostridia bacterium]